MNISVRFTGKQHEILKRHLLPEDGMEAVAVLLCGRRHGTNSHILTVRKVELISYDDCTREPLRITWGTEGLIPFLEEASRKNLAVVKVHSHPGGYEEFSYTDDLADRKLFDSVYGWMDNDGPHASLIMLPEGKLIGRAVLPDGTFKPLAKISVSGENLHYWPGVIDKKTPVPESSIRNAQTFGTKTARMLRELSVGVVGCSGIGSIVIEQLYRLGVGKLVLVDHDRIETVNLNRIINATVDDAVQGLPKVEVIANAIRRSGMETEVAAINKNLFDIEAIQAISECDFVFGCMDSVDGRHLLNKVTVFYNLPYIDVGVKLVADGNGGVEQVAGTVHYLQPDGSSLLSRGTYSMEDVRAASIRRTDPSRYAELRQQKYIAGANEESPAVISVNMQFAAMAVNEFLARLHPYRDDENAAFAIRRHSLSQEIYYAPEKDGEPCSALSRHVGRGDVSPLLDMPEFSWDS